MPKFNVTRSTEINATPETVFQSVRNFRQWPTWSPWLIAEPDCQLEYAEDGSSYSWEGQIVGSGSMKVTSESAPDRIDYELTFLKPYKSQSTVGFQFEATSNGTKVTWTMDGSLPIFLFWMKKMMMAMLGMDYERGLKMLKPVIENGKNPSNLEFIGSTETPGCRYLGKTTECNMSEIGDRMSADFTELKTWIDDNKIATDGAPFSSTHRFDMVNQNVSYTAAIPIKQTPSNQPGSFIIAQRPNAKTYAIRHTGPYLFLGNAWSAGMIRARSKVFQQDKQLDCFEVYENNPMDTAPEELITTVHFPIR